MIVNKESVFQTVGQKNIKMNMSFWALGNLVFSPLSFKNNQQIND